MQNIPECLKESWIVKNYKTDADAVKIFLNSSVDTAMLQELKKAASLVEAPNVDKKPDMEKLSKMYCKSVGISAANSQCYCEKNER